MDISIFNIVVIAGIGGYIPIILNGDRVWVRACVGVVVWVCKR